MRFGLGLALGRRHAASAGDSAQKSMTLTVTSSISGTETFNYAPLAVTVEANPTGFPANSNSVNKYDGTFAEIQYIVDWDDPGTTFSAPNAYATGFNNRNVTIGKKSTHVYRSAGTYTVTVYAYDYLGNWAVQTADVTVKADDFTAANTIVMDTSGSFAGAPSSSYQVTSWGALRSALAGLRATQSIVKVYGKYGDSYSHADGLYHASCPNFIMDAWGTPGDGNPVYEYNRTSSSGSVFNGLTGAYATTKLLKVTNWDFTNNRTWDPTTDLANGNVEELSLSVIGLTPATDINADILIDNGTATGFGQFIDAVGGPRKARLVAHDTNYKDGKEYFFYGSMTGADMSFVGCRQERPANSLNTAESRWENGLTRQSHTAFRLTGLTNSDVIIHDCDFLCRHGWNIQNGLWDQAFIRSNTNGDSSGYRLFVTRNWIEGGISSENAIGTGVMSTVPTLIESNVVITNNPQGGANIRSESNGWVVRNNIFLQPATESANCLSLGQSSIELKSGNLVAAGDNDQSKNIVEANQFIDLRADAHRHPSHQGIFYSPNASYETDVELIIRNNVYHAPNLSVPDTAYGPLASTSLGAEGRYDGIRVAWELADGTLGGDVAPSGTLVIPYSSLTTWDGSTMTQSDFSGTTGRSYITLTYGDDTTDNYRELGSDISITFGASGVTIENTSVDTWPGSTAYHVHLDRGTTCMATDTAYATPTGTTKTYAIAASSAGYEGATGNVPPLDFFGAARRGSNHPNATAGTPSPGALEEVTAQTGSALLETGDVVLLETADAMLLG